METRRKVWRRVAMLVLLLVIAQACLSKTTSSEASGEWYDEQSWTGAIPGCGNDSIIIRVGEEIRITAQTDYTGCASPKVIIVKGQLRFVSAGSKLRLPSSSKVIIEVGGELLAGNSGNSNKIFIGGKVVWENKDDDVPGYRCFGCGTLPVELTSFQVIDNGSNVLATWTTKSEINNDRFELQRSEDGMFFETTSVVYGAGDSQEELDYKTYDHPPRSGGYYYRLKQVDFDGESAYSARVYVKLKSKLNSQVKVIGNGRHVGVWTDNGPISFQVIDRDGRLEANGQLLANEHWSSNTLSSGLHIIRVRTDHEVYCIKVVLSE